MLTVILAILFGALCFWLGQYWFLKKKVDGDVLYFQEIEKLSMSLGEVVVRCEGVLQEKTVLQQDVTDLKLQLVGQNADIIEKKELIGVLRGEKNANDSRIKNLEVENLLLKSEKTIILKQLESLKNDFSEEKDAHNKMCDLHAEKVAKWREDMLTYVTVLSSGEEIFQSLKACARSFGSEINECERESRWFVVRFDYACERVASLPLVQRLAVPWFDKVQELFLAKYPLRDLKKSEKGLLNNDKFIFDELLTLQVERKLPKEMGVYSSTVCDLLLGVDFSDSSPYLSKTLQKLFEAHDFVCLGYWLDGDKQVSLKDSGRVTLWNYCLERLRVIYDAELACDDLEDDEKDYSFDEWSNKYVNKSFCEKLRKLICESGRKDFWAVVRTLLDELGRDDLPEEFYGSISACVFGLIGFLRTDELSREDSFIEVISLKALNDDGSKDGHGAVSSGQERTAEGGQSAGGGRFGTPKLLVKPPNVELDEEKYKTKANGEERIIIDRENQTVDVISVGKNSNCISETCQAPTINFDNIMVAKV